MANMGAKLAILGAAGAATLGAVGASLVAYNYFFDGEQGAKRRQTTMAVATSALDKAGMKGMEKDLMSSFMTKLANAGK